MQWDLGYKTESYGCFVNPVTWGDAEKFSISSGSINKMDSGLMESADIDCYNSVVGSDKWIRLYMDVRQGGEINHVPVFTGLSSVPENDYDGMTNHQAIECYSVLKPAQDVYLPIGWYAAKGFVGSEQIRRLLSVCPAPIVVHEGSPRLSQHIVAENDETNLTMAEKILEAINWRLRIHGDGTIEVCPYDTEPRAVFSILRHNMICSNISVKDDKFSCPNVFRAVSDDASYTAYDHSNSQFSITSRGREVWAEESSVKLGTDETLKSYAERRLKELQDGSQQGSYDRAFYPDIVPTDVIRLHYPSHGLNGKYTVTSQKIDLDSSGITSEEVKTA